jgi:hypothetical protein
MSSEVAAVGDSKSDVKDDVKSHPTVSITSHDESMGSYDVEESTAASTLPSGATTPAQPDLTFPSRVQEAIQLKTSGSHVQTTSSDAVIIGIAVVDFNHLVGPQVEYAHPKELLEDEELCGKLPFLALPDGSHLVSSS